MEEKLNPQEKVMLSCNMINVMAMQAQHLMLQLSTVETCKESAQEIYEQLESTAKHLNVVMNDLGDFMNNRDAVSELDVRLYTPIWEELNK